MARASALAAAAVLLLVAGALAGCTAKPAEPVAAPPKQEEQQPGLVKSSDVANMSQSEDQSDFAKSLDDKFHTHNYWGGALEKVIFDEDVASGPIVHQNSFGPLGAVIETLIFLGLGRGVGFTVIEPPDGAIIPPETDRLEVTVTWADSPTITGLRLVHRSALPNSFVQDGPVENGKPLTIATNLTMNDIPHTTVSKWRFYLAPYDPNTPATPFSEAGAGGVFNGTAHISVKAFRNDTLFVAPPHPDFWGANTTKHITTNSTHLKGTSVLFPIGTSLDGSGGTQAFMQLPNGTIVPPHTKVLTVTLNWTNISPVPNVNNIRPALVYFSGRSSAPHQPAQDPEIRGNSAVYTLALDPRDVDSPYAEHSAWAFVIYLRSDTDQGFGFGSIGDFDGDVTLNADAERES